MNQIVAIIKPGVMLLVSMLSAWPAHTVAQATVGSGKVPETYSLLELDSKKGGLRLNQIGADEKKTISGKLDPTDEKAKGLVILDKTSNSIQHWDGKSWKTTVGAEKLDPSGSYLQSQGGDKYPQWESVKFPTGRKGEYYLYSMQVMDDDKGFVTSDTRDKYIVYKDTTTMSEDNWHPIEGLTTYFNIPEVKDAPEGVSKNKVSIVFQTSAQIGSGIIITDGEYGKNHDIPYISFGIGFFVGNKGQKDEELKLLLVRADKLNNAAEGSTTMADIISIEGTLENLTPGDHVLKVAVSRRTQTTPMIDLPTEFEKSLAIGTVIPGTKNYNSFMTKSYMQIKTYVLNTDEE